MVCLFTSIMEIFIGQPLTSFHRGLVSPQKRNLNRINTAIETNHCALFCFYRTAIKYCCYSILFPNPLVPSRDEGILAKKCPPGLGNHF